jgi:adenylosuccinate lyase
MVQTEAMRVWKEKKSFKELILANKNIRARLSAKKIEEIFDVRYHLKYINAIFKRVFTS